MKFRKAESGDLDRVNEIYEKILQAEETGERFTGWQRGVYPVRATAEAALRRGDLYVGEENGNIVGSAVLNHTQVDCYAGAAWQIDLSEDRILVMHTLTVDPDAAGRGLGMQFVNFYEQQAAAAGCLALRIDTQERNTRARAMYRKAGFREIGIVPCVFNGIPNVQLVLLEKAISGRETRKAGKL